MLKKLKSNAKDWLSSSENKFSPADRGVKKLTMCKKCYTFYYRNSWHFERPEFLDKNYEIEVPVHFTECLACMEQEQASYDKESELVFA
jgi:hypothetical protein